MPTAPLSTAVPLTTPGSTPATAADIAVLAAIAGGDSAALGLLYDRYEGPLFGLAYAMLQCQETAAEVTQEIFLSVWQRAASYQPSLGTPRSWLFSIARHRTVDVLRRRQARPSTVAWPEHDYLAGSFDTWSVVSESLTAEDLRTAVASLAPQQREVIALAYFGGYRYPEVADRLGIPLGTVKSRMRVGLEQLRLRLMTVPHQEVSE